MNANTWRLDDDSSLPLVEEVSPVPEPETAFRRLATKNYCLFLDSALRHPELGRYSFLAADPVAVFAASTLTDSPLRELAKRVESTNSAGMEGLPPFQGGWAGLFSYELASSLEAIPQLPISEFPLPTMLLGLYDVVLAYDHLQETAWIVSQGFSADGKRSRNRAAARLRQFREWVADSDFVPEFRHAADVRVGLSTPQYPAGGHDNLTSNFSADQYRAVVGKAVEYIHAGDIFQVNLSQRLLHPARDHAADLYLRLRRRNPAPFAGYFDLGDFQIVSASPERFLQVQNRRVEARPIKGTRQCTKLPEADLFAGSDLMLSEKDRAENIMIVDLMRNDLSRVCQKDSVQVTQLCDLEVYGYVQHLVSAVRGELEQDCSPIDLLSAAFPAGSITGAPKIRAMEIISELETTSRGAYCGSLGYVSCDGSLDLSVLIRTITAGAGWWQLPVGGGVVAQSSPFHEYEETWHKAAGMLRALV